MMMIAVAGLPRIYAVTQKDDWRGAAEYVMQIDDQALVVFYEDIGVTSYRYYDPDVRSLPLQMDFDPSVDTAAMATYESQMRAAGTFWVLYTLASPADDLPPAEAWFGKRFELIDESLYRGVIVQRYQTP